MRLAANLLWCVPGAVGGSEEYLTRQLLGLADVAPDLATATTVYALHGYAAAHPDVAAAFRIVSPSFDGASRPRRIVGESTWLRARTTGADLVHHGGGTAPLAARRPYLLTIHDLQYRTFPQYFSARKRRYLDAVIPRSARRAALVAVPTEYVRGTVIDAFGLRPERVQVVPHGVEPAVASNVTPAAEVRARYGLGDGPFCVYPAVTHPHKRHRRLVELLAGPWRERDIRIVCCGGIGAAEGDLAGADRRLVRLGRVPDADRNGLVAAAEALLFPSSYEGFGAPLIEAMTLGTPVVCSSAAALPEVAGDAAVVRPDTVEAWADVLDDVSARRAELVESGRRRAAQFTSARSGTALAAAYRTVLDGRV